MIVMCFLDGIILVAGYSRTGWRGRSAPKPPIRLTRTKKGSGMVVRNPAGRSAGAFRAREVAFRDRAGECPGPGCHRETRRDMLLRLPAPTEAVADRRPQAMRTTSIHSSGVAARIPSPRARSARDSAPRDWPRQAGPRPGIEAPSARTCRGSRGHPAASLSRSVRQPGREPPAFLGPRDGNDRQPLQVGEPVADHSQPEPLDFLAQPVPEVSLRSSP